jgi:hypothetical protein
MICKLFQVWTSPDSSILGYEQEGQRDYLEFIQEFFSCLIDNAGTIRSVLEKPLVAFHPDAESTMEKPGRLRVLAFKADRFFDY